MNTEILFLIVTISLIVVYTGIIIFLYDSVDSYRLNYFKQIRENEILTYQINALKLVIEKLQSHKHSNN